MSLDPTDPVALLAALIRCPSVTPAEGGALAALEAILSPMDFAVARPVFSNADTPDVENLFAARGTGERHLVFAGHTDVVPPGDLADWRHDPFAGAIADGEIFGRGAADMKGAIACFIAALARLDAKGATLGGRVSLLITGDEEGPAVNGTDKLLSFAHEAGERFTACIVGEPTNPNALGDMIKIGRRGSLSGTVTLLGRQGHVAYPHLADNPARAVAPVLDALLGSVLDEGTQTFQPSNLEIASIDAANPSTNVIPARIAISFNVRFNDCWTPETLRAELVRRIEAGLADPRHRTGREPLAYRVEWKERPAEAFHTRDDALTQLFAEAVAQVTGRRPELSTSGGTSDARFIKDYCPVIEFGLVGKTMHMANERVALADLEQLTAIYETFLTRWFAADA